MRGKWAGGKEEWELLLTGYSGSVCGDLKVFEIVVIK